MDRPLTKWYCDRCDKVIEGIVKGYAVWKSDEIPGKQMTFEHSFRIVHHVTCNTDRSYPSSVALKELTGADGLSNLLSKLSPGPFQIRAGIGLFTQVNMDQYIDFIRRIHVPYYEQARRYFDSDLIEGTSEENALHPYMVEKLREIIEASENRAR